MAKRILKITGKVLLIALASVLALVILFLASLNIAKFAIYPDYYAIKTNVCENPGLSDGFVCQDVCAHEESGKFLVSGYMKDGVSASRIYVTDKDNNSFYVSVKLDGKDFAGHADGIAYKDDTAYLVCDGAIHIIPLQSILGAQNGDTVEISEVIPLNNGGAFVYTDGDYLYIGEFHNGTNYIMNHPYETPDGTYNAIMCRYTFDDLTKPNKVYSITNQVQGACITPDGKIIFSTSYGLADSFYYVYNESDAIDSGLTFDGAPVYLLCEPRKIVKGPAMSEGLDYYDGKVITLTESASNKYIFGKFFFANKIVGLEF